MPTSSMTAWMSSNTRRSPSRVLSGAVDGGAIGDQRHGCLALLDQNIGLEFVDEHPRRGLVEDANIRERSTYIHGHALGSHLTLPSDIRMSPLDKG